MTHVRRFGAEPRGEGPPQRGLPVEVGVQRAARAVGVHACGPVGEQLRALRRVGGEQPGDAARDGVAPPLAQLGLGAILEMPQMRCERAAPGLIQVGVDDLEQRPGHGVGRPRVALAGSGQLGDQRPRRTQRHPGTHPVGAVTAAKDVREALAEPAFHPACGHQHEFLGKRIGQRRGEQRAESVREQIRALGAVQVKGHRSPI